MSKQRIETLTHLKQMMDSGELPRSHWKLNIDGGSIGLQCSGPLPEGMDRDDDEAWAWCREQESKYEVIFSREDALFGALRMAGIPHHVE